MNNLVLGFNYFVSKLKDYPQTIMSVYFYAFLNKLLKILFYDNLRLDI